MTLLNSFNGFCRFYGRKIGIKGENMENETLLTPDELCTALKVKKATLRGWIYRDKIPFLKIGGALRFRPSALQDWLRQREYLPKADRN